MAFSIDKVLSDLRNVADYATFRRIVDYVENNSSEYTPHDYDILMDNIDELKIKRFQPKECSQIKNIYYVTKEGYRSQEWIPLGHNYSMGVCVDALELKIPLDQYLFDLFPDMSTYKIDKSVPSEYEREAMRGILPSMEERKFRRGTKLEEVPESEVSVGIDVASLLEQQRIETKELVEAAQSENLAEMKRLRENINSLKEKLESLPPEPGREKTISRILDTSQFNYFQRNVLSLDIPVRQKRVARGEYEVSIDVSSPEQEQKVMGFLADVEEHATVSVSKGRIRPPGFDEVLDLLCRNYEKHSGMSCGLSRTGALSTLAERLVEYAANKETEWDKLFDIYSMDLFSKSGKIYTREQADEAFNNAVRQIESRMVSRRTEEEFEEACSTESMLAFILDFDAVGLIETEKYLSQIPEHLKDLQREAIQNLSKCDYYPNRLEELRNEADLVYGEMGTSYNDQLSAIVSRYVRRYGEGE